MYVLQTYGHVDIVINNAGILRDKTFKRMPDADWDMIMKVHIGGVYGPFERPLFDRVIGSARYHLIGSAHVGHYPEGAHQWRVMGPLRGLSLIG